MRRSKLIAASRGQIAQRVSWTAGIALPRPGSLAEIAYAHREMKGARPLLPVFAVIGMATAIGVGWLSWPPTSELTAWLAASVLVTMLLLFQVIRPERLAADDVAAAAHGLVLCSAAAGALWGSTPSVAEGLPATAAAISMLVIGLISLARTPLAAVAYIVLFGAAMLSSTDGAMSGAVAASVVAGSIMFYVIARQQMREHGGAPPEREVVRAKRLASAFESCGNGWFWETDERGLLTYISSTFGDALGAHPDDLKGRPLEDLIAIDVASADASDGDRRSLAFHIQAQLPFFDVKVPVRFPVGIHWWSLSGTPIYSKHGHFDGFSGIGTDLTDVRRSEDRASQLARFDPLTGLANRLTIRETLEAALAQTASDNVRCALLLLDLDRFKSVNDTLGHPVGDKLLEQVAERLATLVGSDGRVGRLGGDEFAIVTRDSVSTQKLASLAARVIDYLSAPYTVDGNRIVIGASVGISIGPDHGKSVEALLRNADLALYAAKGTGRGKYHFYKADMHRDAEARRQLENDLRQAIVQGTLSLAFQPIVDTNSEKLVGFEALARWRHPVHGDIPPSRFIPIAEETGLIESIGEWVIRSACAAAAKWPSNVSLAVNLSPLQFASPDLVALVVNALAQSTLPPARLELEITEGVFLEENPATRATLQRLHSLGVRLTLDDFGTGYSSLAYLNRAPFTKIKIDRAFVSGASAKDGQKAAIIKAIVALADSLGMATTAEGAETHDDLDVVRSLGCTQVQGFIFGKAVSEAAAGKLARSDNPLTPSGHRATRERRIAVLRRASILHRGNRRHARLRNSSPTGAMYEANWSPEIGERVHINIDTAAPQSGIVRWVQEDRFGLLFDDAYVEPQISERQLSAFRRAANAA